MKRSTRLWPSILLLVTLSACSPSRQQAGIGTPGATAPELFTAAKAPAKFTPVPTLGRSRLVKVNLSLLLDEQGQALPLPENAEIFLNLFSDVAYTGIIENLDEGEGITWTGHLKDVPTSELYMVYTAGTFIGHFASPSGVYEVSSLGNDLYQVVQLDPSGPPGGDEPPQTSATPTP
jgi:hypothetical protein